MGVLESTFYRYAKYASQSMVAQLHGNSGFQKPRAHTVGSSCYLEMEGHRSRIEQS